MIQVNEIQYIMNISIEVIHFYCTLEFSTKCSFYYANISYEQAKNHISVNQCLVEILIESDL